MLEIERDVPLEKILKHLNKKELFFHRWGWKLVDEEYAAKIPFLESDLKRLLEDLEGHLHLSNAIGSFEFEISGNEIIFEGKQSLYFPTVKRKEGYFCILDYIKEMPQKNLSLFMCTCGDESTEYRNSLAKKNLVDYFYTDGILSELAESLAEHVEQKIRARNNYPAGKRYSPGVQSIRMMGLRDYFPIENQKTLFSLLEAEKIGMRLSPSHMLIPEKSVSGIFVPVEKARWL